MLKIKLINVPIKGLPYTFERGGETRTFLTALFKNNGEYKDTNWVITEGGDLNNTRYRAVYGAVTTWIDISEHNGTTAAVHAQLPNDKIWQINLIRLLRNYCESTTSSEHKPYIESYESDNQLSPEVIDELAKAITPTKGFAERQYVLCDPDEPFFVLLGRDPQAPRLVDNWANLRSYSTDPDDAPKSKQAKEIAVAMAKYREANPTRGLSKQVYEQILQLSEKRDKVILEGFPIVNDNNKAFFIDSELVEPTALEGNIFTAPLRMNCQMDLIALSLRPDVSATAELSPDIAIKNIYMQIDDAVVKFPLDGAIKYLRTVPGHPDFVIVNLSQFFDIDNNTVDQHGVKLKFLKGEKIKFTVSANIRGDISKSMGSTQVLAGNTQIVNVNAAYPQDIPNLEELVEVVKGAKFIGFDLHYELVQLA